MSPIPTQMRNRWRDRAEPDLGHGKIYWHMLFHDQPEARATAKEAQARLSRFEGLHMTPEKWLHMTALIAGTTDQVSPDQMTTMLSEASQVLSRVHPIPVTLGRVMYHPEAIMLGIRPERALDPILEAVQQATRRATDSEGIINGSLPSWTPHMTVSYSTADQPSGPIVASLGKEVPGCEVVIRAVSLVIQWGPERLWDWEPVGTVQLGAVR